MGWNVQHSVVLGMMKMAITSVKVKMEQNCVWKTGLLQIVQSTAKSETIQSQFTDATKSQGKKCVTRIGTIGIVTWIVCQEMTHKAITIVTKRMEQKFAWRVGLVQIAHCTKTIFLQLCRIQNWFPNPLPFKIHPLCYQVFKLKSR